jgi:threonine dehydratase
VGGIAAPAMHRVYLERVELAAKTIDPLFLHTPQFICEPLSEHVGAKVVLKVETLNPIRSFKGRGADFLASQVKGGVHLLCASAGNFGQAMAYACRKRGIKLTVYAATSANPLKIERMRSLGANLVLHGLDFDAAKAAARSAAAELHARFVEDSLDVETLEGAATIAVEWLTFPEPLDVLPVALGNGALFSGIARVMKERSARTRMIAVQAAGAPAMIESWRAGRVIAHDQVQTIADGIAVRVPIPQALEDMQGLVDEALLVSDSSIVAAMRLLHRYAGVVAEPAGAVALAALVEYPEVFSGKTVGVVVCGGNVTDEQMREWL